jgi:PAS domain S-box-containing protein
MNMESSSIKILLIDDDPDLLEISKQFLELTEGFSVQTAVSADKASALFRSHHYDVIVSDYQMPGKDGIELLKEIRGTGDIIPFILFTGKGREDVAIEALNAGADYYLQKGGDPKSQFAELRNMISKSYEKHQMELDLVESEDKFKNIFNSANDSIYILHLNGRIHEINDIGCELLGYSKQELLQKNVTDINSKEFAEDVSQRLKEVNEKGSGIFETEWITKGGKRIPVEVNSRRITYAGREAILSVARDITERRRSKKSLCESEEKFNDVFDWTNDAIFLHVLTEGVTRGSFVEVNQIACDMLGYSKEELLALGPPDIVPYELHPQLDDIARQAEEMGASLFETRLQRKDGSTLPVESSTHLVNKDGRRIWISIVRDITERKRNEEMLKKSEAQYRLLAENLTDVIGIVDANGAYTYITPSVFNLRGYTPEEVYGQTIDQILTERSIPIIQGAIQQNSEKMKQGIVPPPLVIEVEQLCKDGSTVWVESVTNELFDLTGKHIGGLVVLRNITKRKRMEMELRESEKSYRLLIESAAEAIVVIQDGMIRLANPSTVLYTGLSEQELKAKPFPALIHPDDRAMVVGRHHSRLKGEALPDRYQFRLLVKDGRFKWIELNAVLINWEGRPATLNFMTDVTERKRVEEELRLSEAKHRSLFENMLSGSAVHEIICDADGAPIDYRFLDLNPAFEKMTGLSRDAIIGRTVRDVLQGRIEDVWIQRYGRVALTGKPDQFENYSEAFGKFYEVTVYRNAPMQFTVLFNDVTERKRAEEALRESETQLHTLLQTIPDLIWLKDKNGVFLTCNTMFERFFGAKVADIIGKTDYDFVDPDLADSFLENDLRAMEASGPTHNEEWVTFADDGHRALLDTIKTPMYNTGGALIGILGIGRDITDRKRTEVALNEANKKLNLLSSITRHDINNQLIVLSGNLSLIDKKVLDPSSEKRIKKAEAAAERISAMIQFTKEYEGIGIQSAVWHDIRKLVDEEAGHFTHPNARIVNDIPEGTEVLADQLIQKVFGNLIQNSVRHGGGISTIRFSAEEKEGGIVVIYEDDGVGISEEVREHLFMQGYGRDHGLGLFLSREILAITNITISENGRPGHGVRFEMNVPAGNWRHRS